MIFLHLAAARHSPKNIWQKYLPRFSFYCPSNCIFSANVRQYLLQNNFSGIFFILPIVLEKYM
jgi:hypothetical protein